MDIPLVQQSLLDWYNVHKRDLPWRRTRDPYAILVSEVMCQQTRVDVVIPYFQAWMIRWPTVESLAMADDDDVVAAWSGLGYYRRARNLHAAAKHVALHGWPDDLRVLPGVGPYIDGAVSSIAFGRAVPAIDGNVERVLARFGNIMDDVTKAKGRGRIEELATDLVDAGQPGEWTQAIMELGATLCTPTSPQCGTCPIASQCQTDAPESLPVKPKKRPPVVEAVHFAVVYDGGHVLFVRRPEYGLLGGTWGLPGGYADVPLEDHVRQQTGWSARMEDDVGTAAHVFSHRRWEMQVQRATLLDGCDAPGVRWVPSNEIAAFGTSTAMRKALAALPGLVPQAH